MKQQSLDHLLVKLHEGDDQAAEAVFRAYEPYLRIVVRRQLTTALRAKFDSVDIVQSVWVDLLQGFREAGWRFGDAAQLRAFLVRATKNRFVDRIRQHSGALKKEQPLAEWMSNHEEQSGGDRDGPTALARANELWDQLLANCPPAHRAILDLKRQGYGPNEIAKKTQMHPGSVRRILYDMARRLAEGPL